MAQALPIKRYDIGITTVVTNIVLHRKVKMSEKEKTVKKLTAQIEAILAEKPELKPLQDEIDRLMSKIIDPRTRFQVLSFMICGNIMELQNVVATVPPTLSDMAQLYPNAAPEHTKLTPAWHACSSRTQEEV